MAIQVGSFTRCAFGAALWAACAMSTVAWCDVLHMPFLQASDIVNPTGVQLNAQMPSTGPTFYDKTPDSSVWQTPMASRQTDSNTVQIWYLRVDYGPSNPQDQLTLCLSEIDQGNWNLTQVSQTPAPWGGINNIVMRRSPFPSTWGGFAPHQIVEADNGLQMLFWDQPGPTGSAGAIRATSTNGTSWTKATKTLFTDFNDNFTLRREGGTDYVYHEALQPWPDKPYPDNLPTYRRVISLRTSTDQLQTITPVNIVNPTLAPDALDPIETEFYCLKTFEYGSGYAGILWKYYADPARPNQHSQKFKYELVTSDDGVSWDRPYRDVDLGFYSYADPFFLDGKMWFLTQGRPNTAVEGDTLLKGWTEDRMVAASGTGSFRSQVFTTPDGHLALNANVSTGSVSVSALDANGTSIPGMAAFQITSGNGILEIPWNLSLLPEQMSLQIAINGAAKVYGITSIAPLALAGDFNSDGAVDAADYAVWRNSFGSSTALPNDNGLGTPVGQEHYNLWKANFGQSGSGTGAQSASAGGVPEPSTFVLLSASLAAGLVRTRSARFVGFAS